MDCRFFYDKSTVLRRERNLKMFNIKSKWYKSLTLSFVLAGSVFVTLEPTTVNAESTQEMQEKKEQVDAETKKLEQEIANLQEEIKVKTTNFNKIQEDIKIVDANIVTTEERIAERSGILADRAVAYQGQDDTVGVYLSVLMDAENFSDLMDRVVAVKTIMDADQELLEGQEQDKVALAEQKEELKNKQQELQTQFQELQEKEGEVELKIAENVAKSAALQTSIEKQQEAEAEYERLLQLQSQSFSNDNEVVAGNASAGPSSNVVQSAIATGSQFIGRGYVWGGNNPSTGFDCSGLVQWSYGQAGISLPRTSSQQYLASQKISKSEAKAGDLVFFSYGSGVAHVGIYLGNNQMLNSQSSGVKIESLDWWNKYLVGFGRIAGAN